MCGEDSCDWDDEGRRTTVKMIILMRIVATGADVLTIYEFCVMQVKFLFLSLEKGSFPFRFKGLLLLITTASLTSHLLVTSSFCFLELRNYVLRS